MAAKIAASTLNASTLDILNTIRANASYDYQQSVPTVTKATDIPVVGQIIYGTPAFANQFINALVNRIALVVVKGAVFNNPYSRLKKGYLEFGETVEDIFVSIANVVDYTPEKGEAREFKRTMPNVKSAFYAMNWRVMYPVTIQDNDLQQAFLSMEGVQNLIAKIVDNVYRAAEYDEFLLFKYLLIKAISSGKMYPKSIGDGSDLKTAAVAFRGVSNMIPFMSSKYNEAGVKTSTPKDRQAIFMDAEFNADFDVNVLSGAFNMEKADFMGRLHLIDDWTSFDNDRFTTIMANSTEIKEITDAELTLMKDVKAVILDEEWFQVYDNLAKFTEKYIASGLYWNYFYHTWKTIAHSPFANAVVFVTDSATITALDSFMVTVDSKDSDNDATVLTLSVTETDTLQTSNVVFNQTAEATAKGVAIQSYGAMMIPADVTDTFTLTANIGDIVYTAGTAVGASTAQGASITFTKS